MRKFAAHYIFPVSSEPIKRGIVVLDDSGLIVKLIDRGEEFREEAGLEFHNGLICPSFLNLLAEFSGHRFFQLFPDLEPYQSIIPENTTGEKAILEWMKQIHLSGKGLSLERLIRIFTFESAKAIELAGERGSIAIGKRPGLIVISGINYEKMQLTSSSSLKKLI